MRRTGVHPRWPKEGTEKVLAERDQKRAEPKGGSQLLRRRFKVIDLTQDIFEGMPIWPGHQLPFQMTNQTHEEFKERWGTEAGFEAHNWLLSEHTGTHCDAILEYDPQGASIDHMPLEYFYGEAICIDLTGVRYPDYITPTALQMAVQSSGQEIHPGDIVILFTGHTERTYPSQDFARVYTGLNREAAVWLAEQGVVNIGIDSVAIDHSDDREFSGHMVCKEYGIVNTESLTNLRELLGKRFLFFGLPLKFRRGTGSPVRAVAWLEEG